MRTRTKVFIIGILFVALVSIAQVYPSNFAWCPNPQCWVAGCGCPWDKPHEILGDCCFRCYLGYGEWIYCCGPTGCHPL